MFPQMTQMYADENQVVLHLRESASICGSVALATIPPQSCRGPALPEQSSRHIAG
jgi:hypothetical protein